jgi:uncharacterized damage-inducible protein DinB
MSAQPLLHALFKYKAWANEALFAEFAKVDPGIQPVERNAVIRVLNDVYVVDRIFAAHLSGERHNYTATNTPETPSLEDLRSAVGESDRWYVDYVGKMSPQSLQEKVRFTFVDGALGCMSREEILAHVATHGDYHRGAAGRIDVIATALQARMRVPEVEQLDLAYSPPFSSTWDPLLIAPQQLI